MDVYAFTHTHTRTHTTHTHTHTHTHISSICIIPLQKILIFEITESKGKNIYIETNVLQHSFVRANEITKVFKILDKENSSYTRSLIHDSEIKLCSASRKTIRNKQHFHQIKHLFFGYRSYCLYNYVSWKLAEPFDLDWDSSRRTDVLTLQAWTCALHGPISVRLAVPLQCAPTVHCLLPKHHVSSLGLSLKRSEGLGRLTENRAALGLFSESLELLPFSLLW